MSIITKVIKYEGDNTTFIWKHPVEDFDSMTQLIVHESQEAIFFLNGQALDLFGPGRYTLETEQIPVVSKFINRIAGGDSPFHSEVYFINKTVQMAIKWGTDSKVRFIDPNYGVPLEIGASGEMNLSVSDSRKLLTKLVGTTKGIAWDLEGAGFTKSLATSFRPLISSAVKTNLSATIKSLNLNLLEVDENLEVLSINLKNSIRSGLEEYGLTVAEFYITNVVLPENDPNFKRIRELHTISLQQQMIQAEASIKKTQAETDVVIAQAQREAILEKDIVKTELARREAERQLIQAQVDAQAARLAGLTEAEIMKAKGYSEKDVIQAEVQKAYAEGIGNMTITGSGGGMASEMIGLGVGMSAVGVIGSQMQDMFKGFATPMNDMSSEKSASSVSQEKTYCPNCHCEVPANSKFCLECGTKIEQLNENEIICPNCGKKTQKGKFCMECGTPLMSKCKKCGAELPDGAKFCFECGEKV